MSKPCILAYTENDKLRCFVADYNFYCPFATKKGMEEVECDVIEYED